MKEKYWVYVLKNNKNVVYYGMTYAGTTKKEIKRLEDKLATTMQFTVLKPLSKKIMQKDAIKLVKKNTSAYRSRHDGELPLYSKAIFFSDQRKIQKPENKEPVKTPKQAEQEAPIVRLSHDEYNHKVFSQLLRSYNLIEKSNKNNKKTTRRKATNKNNKKTNNKKVTKKNK